MFKKFWDVSQSRPFAVGSFGLMVQTVDGMSDPMNLCCHPLYSDMDV